jgi:pimeloyl-ACP methyl ester carboxylesterase
MRILKGLAILLVVIVLILAIGPFLVPVPPLENTFDPVELADPDSLFIEVNGLTVHYKQMGQGEPAIFLLHGFGASTFSWREVMEPLSEYGTVVAFDRPAFGLTERRMPPYDGPNPYSPDFQVDLLIGLMDELGFEQAVWVGNSAGGTVSGNAALAYPERVLGLIMVDAAVYAGGGSPPWIRPLLRTPQMDHLGPLLARSLAGERGDSFLQSAWHDPELITDEIQAGYRRPLQAHHWDRALWELTKTSRSTGLQERLSELSLPALVVTGDDDRIVPTSDSIRLASELPNASLVVFENCGHVPQEECPQAFMDAVGPFILEFK